MPLTDDGRCFACGARNPAGLKLTVETGPSGARTRFRPRAAHGGYRNLVHGGIIATVLDEVMVHACGGAGYAALTGELVVRFRRPVRVGEELVVEGRVTNQRGRLIQTRAEARSAQGVVAVATGKFMGLHPAHRR